MRRQHGDSAVLTGKNIADLLNKSPEGIRRCMHRLIAKGLVTVKVLSRNFYSLTEEGVKRARFLDSI